MRVSYLSDLHLDLQMLPPELEMIEPGDICILAGDIVEVSALHSSRTDLEGISARVRFNSLIHLLESKFQQILYVFGNHEYYRSVFSAAEQSFKAYLSTNGFDKVIVLNDSSIEIKRPNAAGSVRFYGTPLWTNFNNGNPLSMEVARSFMADYRFIYQTLIDHERAVPITPQLILLQHMLSVDRLTKWLDANQTGDLFVITHHAPSRQAEQSERDTSAAFVSDLDAVFDRYTNIRAWVHGHTHWNTKYKIGQTPVMTNQWGYAGYEKCSKSFVLNSHVII